MSNAAVLGPNQMAWCKANLRGFVDEDGKTRLEKYNEAQRALAQQKIAFGVTPNKMETENGKAA